MVKFMSIHEKDVEKGFGDFEKIKLNHILKIT